MRDELSDLALFMAVAEEKSFTRAAAQRDLSQSAVSHAVRRLEAHVGIKLLNRTSRRVSTTDAGEKLLAALRPGLGMINARIEELRLLGDAPRGRVRLAASKAALHAVLWPRLSQLVQDYPEIQVELNLESRLIDLAEERFDAGIRMREFISPDMIAVKIGPDLRMAAVAAPHYLQARGVPRHPEDLDHHACIGLRFHAHASTYDWEFEKAGQEIVKKVAGPFIFSESDICIEAAKAGHGIAFVTEPEVIDDIERGTLRRVLSDWCPTFEGYYLCYSGRRNISSALRLLIDRLRYTDSTS
ncbi:HTH-type transcriptional regulator YcjZ [Alcanivorax hongdengensis A-11-3]|uniref:HTH-type transcriptional regulator YcjZ n=1 Tax=Alcanivorax hongdengensis A-11-3 TaxID=1177179 RepID=L0WF69_9GAMM|nr:LysR family transcriptional regulator [Alcanivorax hongdengensis]EKF74807.1 HTH-type transcriptional regulator YcjZ [Alcanivorax hongdengensis A-11-3]